MRDAGASDDSAARTELREFFAPGLPALAGLVRGHELGRLPAWLAAAQPAG
jgi:hypothetical protein